MSTTEHVKQETKGEKTKKAGKSGLFNRIKYFFQTEKMEIKDEVNIYFTRSFEIGVFFEALESKAQTEDEKNLIKDGDSYKLCGVKIVQEEIINAEATNELRTKKYCYYFIQEDKKHLIKRRMNYILKDGIVYIKRTSYRSENVPDALKNEAQLSVLIKYPKVSFLTLAFLNYCKEVKNYSLIQNEREEVIDTCYLIELFLKIKDDSLKLLNFSEYLKSIIKNNSDYSGTIRPYNGQNSPEYVDSGFIENGGSTVTRYNFKNLHFVVIKKNDKQYGCILPDVHGIKVTINADSITIKHTKVVLSKDTTGGVVYHNVLFDYNIKFEHLQAFSTLLLSRPYCDNDTGFLEFVLEYFDSTGIDVTKYETQEINQNDLEILAKNFNPLQKELSLNYMFNKDIYNNEFLEISSLYALFPVLGMTKDVTSLYNAENIHGEEITFIKRYTIYNRNGGHFFCVYLDKNGNLYSSDGGKFGEKKSPNCILNTLKQLNVGEFKKSSYIQTYSETDYGNNCLLFSIYFAIFYEIIEPNSSLWKRFSELLSQPVREYFTKKMGEQLVDGICQKIDDECIAMTRRFLIEAICIQMRIYYKIISIYRAREIAKQEEIDKFSYIMNFKYCMENMVKNFGDKNKDETIEVFGGLSRECFCDMSLVNIYFLIDAYMTQEDFIDCSLGSLQEDNEPIGSHIISFVTQLQKLHSENNIKIPENNIKIPENNIKISKNNEFLLEFLHDFKAKDDISKITFSKLHVFLKGLISKRFGEDILKIDDDFFGTTTLNNGHARKLVLDFEALTSLVSQFYERDNAKDSDSESLNRLIIIHNEKSNYAVRGYFNEEDDKLQLYYCTNSKDIDDPQKTKQRYLLSDDQYWNQLLGQKQRNAEIITKKSSKQFRKDEKQNIPQKDDDIFSVLFILFLLCVFVIIIYII